MFSTAMLDPQKPNPAQDFSRTIAPGVALGDTQALSTKGFHFQGWSVQQLMPSKEAVQKFALQAGSFLYKCITEDPLDKVVYCAFLLFSNLSWVLDMAIVPRLPGRAILCWTSRGITALLAIYMQQTARFGKNVENYGKLVGDHKESLSTLQGRLHDLQAEITRLQGEREALTGGVATLKEQNDRLEVAGKVLTEAAKELGVTNATAGTIIETLGAQNERRAALNIEQRAILAAQDANIGKQAATVERMEAANKMREQLVERMEAAVPPKVASTAQEVPPPPVTTVAPKAPTPPAAATALLAMQAIRCLALAKEQLAVKQSPPPSALKPVTAISAPSGALGAIATFMRLASALA